MVDWSYYSFLLTLMILSNFISTTFIAFVLKQNDINIFETQETFSSKWNFFLFVIWVDRRHHLWTNCIIHNKNVEQDVANQYLYLHSTSHAIATIRSIISHYNHRRRCDERNHFHFSSSRFSAIHLQIQIFFFFLMNVKRNAYIYFNFRHDCWRRERNKKKRHSFQWIEREKNESDME